MKTVLILIGLIVSVTADMGSIPFKKGSLIYEPKQDAIIAWNGREQLLYLQTTLSSSEETKVLEVMPLPNRPTVEATDVGVFKRCAFLLPRRRNPGGSGDSDPFAGPEIPAAEVVERKQIGAHDLRVVQLLNKEKFSAWVVREFSKEGAEIKIPAQLLNVIGEYVADDYQWFIFDVINVTKNKAKKTPLKIRFKTDRLYYPMRITRTEKGQTKVALSVITPFVFGKENCVGIPRSQITVPAKPQTIPGRKLKWIDPSLSQLLGNPKEAVIRSWVLEGEIDAFQKDLLLTQPSK